VPHSSQWLLSISVAWLLLLSASPTAALPLWEIQGTSNQIRLLGSIHFLRPRDYPLPEAITNALNDADVVVMELDLSSLDPFEMQSTLLDKAIDPSGRRLEDFLGREAYRKAKDLAAAVDIDLSSMQQYEPWYAALQITQLRLMQLGFDGSFGVETQLLIQAIQQGKEIGGLETLEAQLDSMDSLSLDSQREFLIVTLEEAADAGEELDAIIDAWKFGDVEALETNLLNDLSAHSELYDQLIVQRNRNWTKAIISYTKEPGNYLIIVGALHLIGNDSVLKMLSDEGLRTRQIK
jgi:uncharacterized protein YbaP (TraB family)